jgi:hypothetical protein
VDYERVVLPDHAAAALAHMILAGFGFMGLLVLGFSQVLVPMFALSHAPNPTWSSTALVLACIALLAGTVGALTGSRGMLAGSALMGLAASTIHLAQMRHALATGMRKRLGFSFVLVRVAWAMLPLSIVVGIAALYDLAGPNGATLFGFLLLFGWLLTFLFGILQRIIPFLASMHATRSPGQLPPAVSDLSASRPLQLHMGCHLGALALISASILVDNSALARIGAALGLIGAIAFAWFTAVVIRRVRKARLSQ